MMKLKPETEKAFREHAEREFPNECCGVVIVVNGKERYVACRNAADKPQDHFVIDARDWAEAEDRGEIVGYCHSHPIVSAQPSQCDLMVCEQMQLPGHIVHVSGLPPVSGALVSYEPTGYVLPLTGRHWDHGNVDCYTLVRDYYARHMGVDLPDFVREDNWWHLGKNYYEDNFAACGFEEVARGADGQIDLAQVRIGDIILMQVEANPINHAAIYVGDGIILHHPYNRISGPELYDGYWQDVTRKVIRHADYR